MCVVGFGYEESEYKMDFRLAPRGGDLYPSNPKHRNLSTLHSGTWSQNEVLFRTHLNIWDRLAKLVITGDIYPDIKGQWLYLHVFLVSCFYTGIFWLRWVKISSLEQKKRCSSHILNWSWVLFLYCKVKIALYCTLVLLVLKNNEKNALCCL